MDYDEEYEIIPTSPVRRLEKRLSRVETGSASSEVRRLIDQIVELIKSNQRVIDDIIKADADLRNEISRIPGKIDELLSSMRDMVELIKASAVEEASGGADMEPLTKKIGELVEVQKKNQEIAQATLTSLETLDRRMKRLFMHGSSASQGYRSQYSQQQQRRQ